jgi:hypothetical protein
MQQTAEKLLQFQTAPEAFEWAEEILARHPVESQIAKLNKIRGAGEFTMDEMRDMALTIVSVVSRVEPSGLSLAFRYVYGREDGVVLQDLTDSLMRYLYRSVPKVKGREPRRMVQFVVSVASGYRASTLYKRKEKSMNRIAGETGVSRQALSENGWPDMIAAVRGSLDQSMKRAESWIADELRERGFMA